MTTYRVEVESATLPTVCVDIEQDAEPTQDQIAEALEELAQQIEYEGYVAEYIVTEGGNWTVKSIESDERDHAETLPGQPAHEDIADKFGDTT